MPRNATAVWRLFDPDVVQYLLSLPNHRWMMEKDRVVIVRRRAYAPAELPAVMAAVEGFVARLPEEFVAAKTPA